jgi:hypothetical protein
MRDREFSIFSPTHFFDEFVARAFTDHLGDPTDRYHLNVAIHQANVLAERIWQIFHEVAPDKIANAKSSSAYRSYLAKACPDFQLVWDLDDGHKHVVLRRGNRKVTSVAQTGLRHQGGAFDVAGFDDPAFDTGKKELIVQLDDGTERSVSENGPAYDLVSNVSKFDARDIF